jgi:hypothetical protein
MDSVYVSVNHSRFMPMRKSLARTEFEVASGAEPAAALTMDPGLTIAGRVADETGKPIAGARVRTQFINEEREGTTDADGRFSISGCPPQSTRIVASAPGRAMQKQEVQVAEDMAPVEFAMPPGGHVRILIVDHEGNPSPKARVFFQQWGVERISYFEFDHVNQYANDEGVWEWNEAPLEGFTADICPPGGMQMPDIPFMPRKEEYIIAAFPPVVISGRVVDAETKQPIPAFRMVPGIYFDNGQIHWERRDAREAREGRYEHRPDRRYAGYAVRVEAAGYRGANSRKIESNEAAVAVDFELQRAPDVFGKIVTPDFQPARGAKVALALAGTNVGLDDGDLVDSQTNCARAVADDEGLFRFPPPGAEYELIVTHPEGFARLKSENQETRRVFALTPWARVTGTYRVGTKPAAGQRMRLDSSAWLDSAEDGPSIYASYDATTDQEGRFAFPRVLPGPATIQREIVFMVSEGAKEVASCKRASVELKEGQAAEVNIGGTGRPVLITLKPPADFEGVYNWRLASVSLRRADENDDDFWASVANDGRLRIDDVEPGEYHLSIHMIEAQPGGLGNHAITIPAGDDREPLDLGELQLQ